MMVLFMMFTYRKSSLALGAGNARRSNSSNFPTSSTLAASSRRTCFFNCLFFYLPWFFRLPKLTKSLFLELLVVVNKTMIMMTITTWRTSTFTGNWRIWYCHLRGVELSIFLNEMMQFYRISRTGKTDQG